MSCLCFLLFATAIARITDTATNRCVSAMEAVVTTVTIGALPQVGGGVGDSRNGSGKK
jgi:uncharacterized membrane protein